MAGGSVSAEREREIRELEEATEGLAADSAARRHLEERLVELRSHQHREAAESAISASVQTTAGDDAPLDAGTIGQSRRRWVPAAASVVVAVAAIALVVSLGRDAEQGSDDGTPPSAAEESTGSPDSPASSAFEGNLEVLARVLCDEALREESTDDARQTLRAASRRTDGDSDALYTAADLECGDDIRALGAPPQSTPEPKEREAVDMDPETALMAWQAIWWGLTFGEALQETMPSAMESDFYWIDSVDRLDFDTDSNTVIVDATIKFAGVYSRNRQDWVDDTWSFYRTWSRVVWAGIMEQGDEVEEYADWATWTPALALNGNGGRLTAECPGHLILEVSERRASQADYEEVCSFTQ